MNVINALNALNVMNDAKTERLIDAVIPQTDKIDQTDHIVQDSRMKIYPLMGAPICVRKMSKKKLEYVIRIGPSDRYRHLHIRERGKIVFFRIQYETKIGDRWYPVVRYDTAHGFAHRDIIDLRGSVEKTPLFNQDYKDALTFAESDLKSNWEYYKRRILEVQDG